MGECRVLNWKEMIVSIFSPCRGMVGHITVKVILIKIRDLTQSVRVGRTAPGTACLIFYVIVGGGGI